MPFSDYREYALQQAAASKLWDGHTAAAGALEAAGTEALVFGIERIHEALSRSLHEC